MEGPLSRKLQPIRACTRCGSTTNEFYKCSKVSDGLTSWCKQCFRLYRAADYAANPERKRQRYAKIAEWAKANPEKVVQKVRRWQAANPDKCERVRTRRHLTNRRPAWAVPFYISEIYHLARLRTKVLGRKFVVDHIVPLNNPAVSGLHVETNLRIVPFEVNAAKGNSFSLV